MTEQKKPVKRRYNRYLDLMRAVFCAAVLMYHLGVLPGGYLAVCGFFVLSGYLNSRQFLAKRNTDLKQYYLKRAKRIWIPLAATVLITVGIASCLKGLIWITMKRETLSVLLGYNNFWQIVTNQDYFASHSSSPFTHFWYIAILLQFEILMPLLFTAMRRRKKEFIALVIDSITAVSLLAFIIFNFASGIMTVYYSTFSRLFSLMMGVSLAVHENKAVTLLRSVLKDRRTAKLLVQLQLVIMCFLFVLISSSSVLMPVSMILVSLMTCLMTAMSWNAYGCAKEMKNPVLKFLSAYSYEIYLVQYPVIFFMQYAGILKGHTLPLAVLNTLLTLPLAVVLNTACSMKMQRPVQLAATGAVALASVFGGIRWITAADHKDAMNQLADELSANGAMNESAKENQAAIREEMANQNNADVGLDGLSRREALMKKLDDALGEREHLDEKVINAPLTMVGDSILLGASPTLYDTFPNLYCDAEVSRQFWTGIDIVWELRNSGILSDILLINLGANGNPSDDCVEDMIDACGNTDVFFITVTNDDEVNVNGKFRWYAEHYRNVHIMDWAKAASVSDDYFYADGLHVNEWGAEAYAECVRDTIHDFYAEKLRIRTGSILHDLEVLDHNPLVP